MNRVESMQIDLDELKRLRNEVERNRAAIAELVGALKPFAGMLLDAEHLSRRTDDSMVFAINSNGFTVGDLRNARAAITKHQQPTTTEQKPALYLCTECGGANYGCGCDSFKNCTVPLYTTEKE